VQAVLSVYLEWLLGATLSNIIRFRQIKSLGSDAFKLSG
jgi:hypothetical protein